MADPMLEFGTEAPEEFSHCWDEHFMHRALQEASYAFAEDEVPIGCIIVANNQIIGKGYNQTERLQDPTAHAEMLAITAACNHLGAKYLPNCTVYVTIEPCPMCAAALRWAQVGRVVWGAPEPKHGFASLGLSLLHPRTRTQSGLLADDCRNLMTEFFKQKRKP